MRVLMFGWEFPPFQAGGLATATLGLVKGLLRQGTDVTLVVPFPAERSELPGLRLVSAAGRMSGLRTIRVASPVTAYGTAASYEATFESHVEGTSGSGVYGRNLYAEVERLASVAADIARTEPHDVIDAHDWITFAAGLAAREASGRPLVAHIHATEYDRAGEGGNPLILERERHGMLAADRVIANSHALKRQVVDRFGVPAGKVDVVHWGVDDEAPRWNGARPSPLPDGTPVVLFLGRVTRQKGPDWFVEVAGRVARQVPEAHFVMAGTGDMLPRVIERGVELGLDGRLHFAGPLGGADVDRAFRMATLCLMPSVSEPFGLVALESLRAGTPCLMPRDSGVAETVRNAFKIDFWDLDDMTARVVALLKDDALRAELSARGLAEVRSPRFSLDEPARLTAASYARSLGGTSSTD